MNVTKELMVKDVVMYGESKYNSAYVNNHLIFKAVSVLTRTHNIHVTHLKDTHFLTATTCRSRATKFHDFFLISILGVEFFDYIYFDYN